jgi:protein-tyrosine kinase
VGFYLEFIRTVFQAVSPEGKLQNRTVAFTSATSGEGVSYVVNSIARELATQTQNRVLVVSAEALEDLLLADPNQIPEYCEETEIDNLLTIKAPIDAPAVSVGRGQSRASEWDTSAEFRKDCLRALRWNFDYVLVDCPALGVSSQATTLAPIVDGVAVVVQAGQTRRDQIRRSQQAIEATGGNFLGFVLNQRRYPVPGWLYRML